MEKTTKDFREEDITRIMLEALTSENINQEPIEQASEEELTEAMELFSKVCDVFENTSIMTSFKVITALSDSLSFYIMQMGNPNEQE